jgi:3-hydroxyisobutyrate dehydrogenase
MAVLGFVGLGNMGNPMVKHLLDAGHEVTVYDLDDGAVADLVSAGAVGADGPKQVSKDANAVFLSLPGPDAVNSVVDELKDALEPGTILIDLTTSTPGTTNRVADRLEDRDVTVLGAPVSGGPAGAKAATLTVMVGGDADAFEECEPLFASFARDVYHISDDPGHGHAMKLLNNYLSFAGLVAASEAVALGEREGLDVEQMLEVFSNSSGRNSATEDKLHHAVDGGFDFGFTLGLMEKDIRLLGEFSDENRAPMVLAGVVESLVGYTRADYGGDSDMTYVYKFCKRMIDDVASNPPE